MSDKFLCLDQCTEIDTSIGWEYMIFRNVMTRLESITYYICFGCGPIIFQKFYLLQKIESQTSFGYFDNICHIISRLFPTIQLQIARILDRFNEETLVFHLLNFGCGRPIFGVFFAKKKLES